MYTTLSLPLLTLDEKMSLNLHTGKYKNLVFLDKKNVPGDVILCLNTHFFVKVFLSSSRRSSQRASSRCSPSRTQSSSGR